ncbi:MAG: GIY-YIG nuclease family protein [Candidatus Shapirobacteria bacterium]
MTKGFVYILKSIKNSSYYIGSTNNLERRMDDHKQGKAKYTKNIRPVELKFFQEYRSLSKARKIEYRLKKLSRKDLIDNIIKDGYIKMGL